MRSGARRASPTRTPTRLLGADVYGNTARLLARPPPARRHSISRALEKGDEHQRITNLHRHSLNKANNEALAECAKWEANFANHPDLIASTRRRSRVR